MLPGMMKKRGIPRPGHWVKTRLRSGRAVEVTTRYKAGQRLVLVRPITEPEGTQR